MFESVQCSDLCHRSRLLGVSVSTCEQPRWTVRMSPVAQTLRSTNAIYLRGLAAFNIWSFNFFCLPLGLVLRDSWPCGSIRHADIFYAQCNYFALQFWCCYFKKLFIAASVHSLFPGAGKFQGCCLLMLFHSHYLALDQQFIVATYD